MVGTLQTAAAVGGEIEVGATGTAGCAWCWL